MSVLDTETIDMMGIDKKTGALSLLITDALGWDEDVEEHLELLQDKINSYLGFIEGDQILEHHLDAREREIEILIMFKESLSDPALEFLDYANTVLTEAGYRLSVRAQDEDVDLSEK